MNRYDAGHRLVYPSGGVSVLQHIPTATNWWEPGGSFTCVAAYAPKGAASLSASYSNLANPGTYDAAPGTAPTFDTATGWTFNGSTTRLETGVVVGSGWTAIVRYSDLVGGALFGANNYYRPYFDITIEGGTYYFEYGTGYLTSTITGDNHVATMAGVNVYLDGASLGAIPATWSGTPPALNIGAEFYDVDNTAYGQFLNGKIQAIAIYSTTLDATQVATLSAAMGAL